MTGIFLDRDGVIVRKAPEGEYIAKLDEMQFLPGALEAIAKLSRSGFKVIVVTNQRGVATGKIKLSDLEDIHGTLRCAVSRVGGEISDIFYCPHDIPESCVCRKPKPGMLLVAAEKHHLSLSECWMVGDAVTDIAAGTSAGCKTALITRTEEFSSWTEQPDICADSLASVADEILNFNKALS